MPSKRNSKKLRKILKYQEGQDVIMDDPREGDLIIPVMGPTGSGKSSFINKALGSGETMKVGHTLKSCTSCLQHAFLPVTAFPKREPEGRVILLDTPGFDDTYIDDVEILRRIAVWLSFSYHDRMKLAGVIYLHDLSQFRISGSVRKNLEMFRFLCGEKAISRVILVTSKWDIAGMAAEERQNELEEDFWHGVMALGARSRPFIGTTESALSIIDMILTRASCKKNTQVDRVLMQAETVDIHRLIPETKVGRTLRHTLKDTAERQKALDEELRSLDRDASPALRREYEENNKRLQATLQQVRDLRIPIGRRFLTLLGLNHSESVD